MKKFAAVVKEIYSGVVRLRRLEVLHEDVRKMSDSIITIESDIRVLSSQIEEIERLLSEMIGRAV